MIVIINDLSVYCIYQYVSSFVHKTIYRKFYTFLHSLHTALQPSINAKNNPIRTWDIILISFTLYPEAIVSRGSCFLPLLHTNFHPNPITDSIVGVRRPVSFRFLRDMKRVRIERANDTNLNIHQRYEWAVRLFYPMNYKLKRTLPVVSVNYSWQTPRVYSDPYYT